MRLQRVEAKAIGATAGESLIGAWLAELERRTGSRRTPAEYGRYLARFLADVDLAEATPAHVQAFAYSPGPSGRTPAQSTVRVRAAALRSFYGFAVRMGVAESNPASPERVKRPRLESPPPKGLEADEYRRLVDAIPEATVPGLRLRAAVATMAYVGLRRSELLGLRRQDLTRNGSVYLTFRAKGGVIRTRELPPPALRAIDAYLELAGRPLEAMDPDARIFDVSGHALWKALRRAARRAGLGPVSLHALRHTCAKLRRASGASLESVQEQLGHRSTATTAIYLRRLEGERDRGWAAVANLLGEAV